MSGEDEHDLDKTGNEETDGTDVDEDVPEAIGDLLQPDPPHSPASDADAPPPG